MIRYKNFAFFIQDDKIYVKDPKNNQVLMVRDAKNVDNKIELGRSMIEQYIDENKVYTMSVSLNTVDEILKSLSATPQQILSELEEKTNKDLKDFKIETHYGFDIKYTK